MAAGSQYCELVLTPEPTQQLDAYLDSCQSSKIDEVMGRLIDTITEVAVTGVSPSGRPTLGIETHLSGFQECTSVPAISNERFMLAIRLARANAGKKLGERFIEACTKEDAAQKNLALCSLR